ncbi:hypothetical protein AGMMS49965_23740 [Bacteroidia bacterium]|nr:hypothetical protein AGMMS49965_23740 [Bacteroidia bacterium]
MKGKIIIEFLLALLATVSQAQNNNKFIPPESTTKTYSFALPELQIDSMFIANLDTVLFDKNDRFMNSRISNPNNRWRHFHIQFEKKDSLNYCITVGLYDIPARKSTGFFEHNGFLYWFGADTPLGIILGTKSKKQFSYKEPIPAPYDPPFWHLIYNKQTGEIEIKERYCFE